MANNLKKVSALDLISPTSVTSADLFYLVSTTGGINNSYALTLASLFLASNNVTTNMRFNEDTLFIKSGRVGINKEPITTLDVAGAGAISGNMDIGGDVSIGSRLEVGSDSEFAGDVSIAGDEAVAGSLAVVGDAYVYGSASVNILKSTNVNPRTSYTELINIIYPIGSIYTSVISTNPNALFGLGTWVAYGEGRVLVGKATSGTFATPGATGGAETVTLTSAQSGVPAHSHPIIDKQHNHTFTGYGRQIGDDDNAYLMDAGAGSYPTTSSYTGITGTENNTAQDATQAHTNLQPYVVVYMWRRTA